MIAGYTPKYGAPFEPISRYQKLAQRRYEQSPRYLRNKEQWESMARATYLELLSYEENNADI